MNAVMNKFSLEGKTALVTGACYGIGFAIAQGLHAAGAKIAFCATSDASIEKALKAYENQDVFTLGGDAYKRSKYPDYPENIRNWLDRKCIQVARYSTDFDLVFSENLGKKLCEDLVLTKDIYDFLVIAENHARGIIKYD